MKALSIIQPWASLIAWGHKRIETRSYSTSYTGPIALHASKGFGAIGGIRAYLELCGAPFFRQALAAHGATSADLPLGAVVAIATLVACVPIDDTQRLYTRVDTNKGWFVPPLPPYEADPEGAFGDYTPGRYAWLLADVMPLSIPIPTKGMLGIWDWTPPGGAIYYQPIDQVLE